MKKIPLVSIIVSTKNEEKNIGRCLKSIKKQTCPNIEIIVVDNDSIDKTKQISRQHTKNVFNKGPERSTQRNFGAQKAKGKYLLFLDADMTLSPQLIKKAVYRLENSNLTALCLSEIVKGKSFWSKVRSFEKSFYQDTVIEAVRFIRKDIFKKVKGFDPSLTGPEDWDLDKRIRKIGQTDILKKAVVYHHEEYLTLKDYLEKKQYYSQSFTSYLKKWGLNDSDIKKQFGFYYRYFGVFIEKGKWKKLIKHPMLAISMCFLRICVGLIYIYSTASIK